MKKIILHSIILLFLLCTSIGAQESQDFISDWIESFGELTNPQNTGLTVFPILELSSGGQKQNMANAYTAFANDISFFESNPAASSLLNYTELAFFHRNPISNVNLESLYFAQQVNSLGYGFGLKFLHFEFTSVDGRGRQLASAIPAEFLISANIAYNFFSNYYFSGLALGANVKLAVRGVPPELYRHVLNFNSSPQDIVGVLFDIGLLSRFNFLKTYTGRDKNFSIGLSLLNFGPPVNGYSPPSEFRVGVSYKLLSFFTLAADFSYLINVVNINQSEGVGFSAGLDIRFVSFLGIQGGFELRGGNPRITIGSDLFLDPIRVHFNYTLDLSTSLNSFSNFSVGISINFGDEGRAEIQQEVDRLYAEALTALTKFEYQRVIDLCNSILDPEFGLDPSFTPAAETLQVALDSLERSQEFIQFEQDREVQQIP